MANQMADWFHTTTGLTPYDAIGWTTRPDAFVMPTQDLPVRAVRRFANEGREPVVARSVQEIDPWDALLVNRGGSGLLELTFCGKLGKSQICHDQVALIPAGADSSFEFPPAVGSFTLYFPTGQLQALAGPEASPAVRPILGERHANMALAMVKVERELLNPGFGSELLIQSLLRSIAMMVYRHDPATMQETAERIHLSPARLRRVIDYVDACISDQISLDDMAQVAGLSSFHFSRVFKLATGETPYQYLSMRRLNLARRLLARGGASLVDVALHCGFANQSHFTAAFTRETGMSPGKFRKCFWGGAR